MFSFVPFVAVVMAQHLRKLRGELCAHEWDCNWKDGDVCHINIQDGVWRCCDAQGRDCGSTLGSTQPHGTRLIERGAECRSSYGDICRSGNQCVNSWRGSSRKICCKDAETRRQGSSLYCSSSTLGSTQPHGQHSVRNECSSSYDCGTGFSCVRRRCCWDSASSHSSTRGTTYSHALDRCSNGTPCSNGYTKCLGCYGDYRCRPSWKESKLECCPLGYSYNSYNKICEADRLSRRTAGGSGGSYAVPIAVSVGVVAALLLIVAGVRYGKRPHKKNNASVERVHHTNQLVKPEQTQQVDHGVRSSRAATSSQTRRVDTNLRSSRVTTSSQTRRAPSSSRSQRAPVAK